MNVLDLGIRCNSKSYFIYNFRVKKLYSLFASNIKYQLNYLEK